MIRQTKYTKETLAPVVSKSVSLAMVLRYLGLKMTGGNYRMINSRITNAGIDTSHFVGSAWNRGKKQTWRPVADDSIVFVENSDYTIGSRIIKRLLRHGLEYECSICHLVMWLGKKITLHLDHINGVHNDNRKENLRLLCPNCHSQTETYSRGCKNKNGVMAKLVNAQLLGSCGEIR